jgi:hypothetical protein
MTARARKAELASGLAVQKLEIRLGDKVLLGSVTSKPMDWFMATVLLVTGGEIATEHSPASNGSLPVRQFLPIGHVRAVSSAYERLFLFQRQCHEGLAEQIGKVNDAEHALATARNEMWAALDAINASAPQRVEPEAT